MKINSENENNQNGIKVLKSYKIYTATQKTCQQTAYHLATFDSMLQRQQELPKYIREETISYKIGGPKTDNVS